MDVQAKGFQSQVIQPVLEGLGLSGEVIHQLLLGAAWANRFCSWQSPPPGLGLYNLTPNWHRRLWDDFLAFQPELASRVRGLASQRAFLEAPHQELIGNIPYATAVAACGLLRHQTQLPTTLTAASLTHCWLAATSPANSRWSTYAEAYEQVLHHRARRVAAA